MEKGEQFWCVFVNVLLVVMNYKCSLASKQIQIRDKDIKINIYFGIVGSGVHQRWNLSE